jgi:parallel beta-helix repeat protein
MKPTRIVFTLTFTCVPACLLLAFSLWLLSASALAWTGPSLPLEQTTLQTIIVPDDYPSIQQAVDHAQPGEQVFVRSGTYAENVRVETPLVLTGESRENTTVDAAGGPYGISIVTSNVRIAGLTVRGGDVGISVAPAPASDNTIEDCIVRGNTVGITIQQSGFPSGTGNLIRNCRFENNDQSGVHLIEAPHNRIENSSFLNSIRAIYVENSSNNIITGTVLTSTFNHYAGILIETTGSGPRATHNRINNCTVSGHYYGIHIKNADDNTVEGCTLFDNTWNGINLYGGSTRNLVRDCSVYGISDTGIDISGQAYGNRVEGCTVTGMQTDGLYLFNTWDNVITDLYVHDVPQYGILLGELGQPTGTYSNTISNCRIENTFRGINAWYNVTHNVIENCVISNSLHQGINLEIDVDENDIKHCRISDSDICDIRFNTSLGNRIWDSTANSLVVEQSSTGRVINSDIDSIQVWSGEISVEWYLTTSVTYRRTPVEGAQVQAYRVPTSTLVAEGPTNPAGWVRFILPERLVRTDNQEQWIGDYSVWATDAGLVMSAPVVLTSSRELKFELAGPGFWSYLPVILRQ